MNRVCQLILFSVILLALSITASVFQGEIISCAGWRLNHLPELRRFLKVVNDAFIHISCWNILFTKSNPLPILKPGNADAYDIKITWSMGRKPELFLRDQEGELVDRIDLTTVRTFFCFFSSIRVVRSSNLLLVLFVFNDALCTLAYCYTPVCTPFFLLFIFLIVIVHCLSLTVSLFFTSITHITTFLPSNSSILLSLFPIVWLV